MEVEEEHMPSIRFVKESVPCSSHQHQPSLHSPRCLAPAYGPLAPGLLNDSSPVVNQVICAIV